MTIATRNLTLQWICQSAYSVLLVHILSTLFVYPAGFAKTETRRSVLIVGLIWSQTLSRRCWNSETMKSKRGSNWVFRRQIRLRSHFTSHRPDGFYKVVKMACCLSQ